MSSSEQDRLALTEFLPDADRAASPWTQIGRDLVAAAPVSDWASRTTAARIAHYDQIRTFVSRGFLLLVLAALLMVVDGTTWLVWPLLLIGATQTFLEIYLDFQLRRDTPPKFLLGRWMFDLVEQTQFGNTVVNATGVLGAVAVIANLVSVLFLTGPGEPGWVKVAALVVAVAYGNSGLLAVLIDATFYSATQRLPRMITFLRPHAWLVATAILIGLMALSVELDRWSPSMVPVAWLTCLLPYLIGLGVRSHDRLLRASGEQVHEAMTAARGRMAQDVHDMFTDLAVIMRAMAGGQQIDATERIVAAQFAAGFSMIKDMADEREWLDREKRFSLAQVADRISRHNRLTATVDLEVDELSNRNYNLARQFIATSIINVVQALRKSEKIEPVVSVKGCLDDGRIDITIGDGLPLIPTSSWCPPGSTMSVIRERIREMSGDLTQVAVGDGKEIRATWVLRYRPSRAR